MCDEFIKDVCSVTIGPYKNIQFDKHSNIFHLVKDSLHPKLMYWTCPTTGIIKLLQLYRNEEDCAKIIEKYPDEFI